MNVKGQVPTANPSVIFSHDNCFDSFLSKDVFNYLFPTADNANGQECQLTYISVMVQGYDSFTHSKILKCSIKDELPPDTVELPSKVFCVAKGQPTIDNCQIWPYRNILPVIQNLAISLRPTLYDQILSLGTCEEQVKYIQLKCRIENKASVIHCGDVLWDSWCRVIDCSYQFQGVLDTTCTKIVLVCDNHATQDSYELPYYTKSLHLAQANRICLRIKGLSRPIDKNLLAPIPSILEDDSMFVFSDALTLLRLGVSSGSYVRVSQAEVSRIARLFVLLSPNELNATTLYACPKFIANFKDSEEIVMEKWSFSPRKIPVAASVSLARVGSWNNCQKVYENIILENLTKYLTRKSRVLEVGDLLPIPFDSSLAPMCSIQLRELEFSSEDDSIVWFEVSRVNFDDSSIPSGPFTIDSARTTLVTENVVSKSPMPITNCNFISYYNLHTPFPFDSPSFDYASKFAQYVRVGIKCYKRGIKMPSTILLHSSTPNVGKRTLVKHTALKLGIHFAEIDCASISVLPGAADTTNKIIGFLKAKLEPLLPFASPSIVLLSHLDSILEKEDAQQDPSSSKNVKALNIQLGEFIENICRDFAGVIIVASVNDIDKLPESVSTKMRFDLQIPVPTEKQRLEIFKSQLSTSELNYGGSKEFRFCLDQNVITSKLALKSAGLTPKDIHSIIHVAKANAFRRLAKKGDFFGDYMLAGHFIPVADIDLSDAIERARAEFSDAIGAPKIPNVTWDDIGGMDIVKGEIMDTIDLPLKHPELFTSGMKKRSGILFYGPPGTGKTLLAKAIATNFSLNFFSVKGPELLNMYIGESEANVRRVFQKARDAKPCVIFFDELDSVAPKRGNQGDSGGVMDRIVSQLLAELDGMSTGGDGVFVIGATNRPDLLDEALLRPGRFDKLLYLGISDTNEKQENILKALTRKFMLGNDVNLSMLANGCPFTYTGADFYALCSDAILNAMTRTSNEIDRKVDDYNFKNDRIVSLRYWFEKVATQDDLNVVVKMQDFLKARNELIPSVSEEELKHYLRIKANFETV